MVGHPRTLHEGKGGRCAGAAVAQTAGRRVQPEAVEMGNSRPRFLMHQSQQHGDCGQNNVLAGQVTSDKYGAMDICEHLQGSVEPLGQNSTELPALREGDGGHRQPWRAGV